jgi:Family of unknown function (DUF6502)
MSNNLKEKIQSIVQLMLRPALKLCLKHSFKLNEIVEMIKNTLVEIAKEELKKTNQDISLSRLSIITGVHRKDATRIERNQPIKGQHSVNVIARIMARWQTDNKFKTKAGKPKTLDAEGKNSEFSQLVNSVTGGDLGSYPILFEMERLGIVKKNRGKISLIWRDFVERQDDVNGLNMLAEDINDLSSAVEENLSKKECLPNLHLKTVFDNCTKESIPKLRAWLLEEGSKLHKKAREYCAQFDKDLGADQTKEGGVRVAFGSFSIIGDSENAIQK